MPVELEGGCLVTELREGEASGSAGVRIWRHADRASGTKAISLRVLEFAPGLSPGLRNATCDEVLYVLEGEATVYLDGHPSRVGPDTGFFLRPGSFLTVDNPGPGPLTLASSRCPDPGPEDVFDPPCTSPTSRAPLPPPFVPLLDRAAETSGDRWYRVLVDEKIGSSQVTQFVGSIPPGRAPDHFHDYEEVLCMLSGRGRMWAGATSTPIAAGSCVFLPRRQVHCVENTGASELRLLGVFYPAGSPAVRYDPS
jgi:mannose-6-phosphate isomerase-like protein (cupin superfamily)